MLGSTVIVPTVEDRYVSPAADLRMSQRKVAALTVDLAEQRAFSVYKGFFQNKSIEERKCLSLPLRAWRATCSCERCELARDVRL